MLRLASVAGLTTSVVVAKTFVSASAAVIVTVPALRAVTRPSVPEAVEMPAIAASEDAHRPRS